MVNAGWNRCLNLPNILKIRRQAATQSAQMDTSLIILWQDGGPNYFETSMNRSSSWMMPFCLPPAGHFGNLSGERARYQLKDLLLHPFEAGLFADSHQQED